MLRLYIIRRVGPLNKLEYGSETEYLAIFYKITISNASTHKDLRKYEATIEFLLVISKPVISMSIHCATKHQHLVILFCQMISTSLVSLRHG